MKILVIDVGGTHVKVRSTGRVAPVKMDSGPTLTATRMVQLVRAATDGWTYDAVSIGIPTPVRLGKPVAEPRNLGGGWVGFDFRRAFGRPVKVINDAAMQAIGSYEGGRMLFLGLGTGLGSAMVVDGLIAPMELAHLPYKKGRTFEESVGTAALERSGKKKWRRHVLDVTARLKAALEADYVVLGGGNAKLMRGLPRGVRLGGNDHAFIGGVRMWKARSAGASRRPS